VQALITTKTAYLFYFIGCVVFATGSWLLMLNFKLNPKEDKKLKHDEKDSAEASPAAIEQQ